jgi:3-phenylpropionate/trans-cinnamate dioxygenase ferredoxin reductase subunit
VLAAEQGARVVVRVVIVGAGLAGLRTAEALRDKGFSGSLTLVGDEVHLPYDRPPLSKHVLRGEREPMLLRPEDQYAELDLDLQLGVAVTGLDVAAKQVQTAHGPVDYDEVVIATGATPRRLPGAPGFVLRTVDDARALAPLLEPGRTIGVIGAGLIGCEVAASARTKGAEVHVVDLLPKPLVRVLGNDVADRVQALHEEHGVQFHLGTSVVQASATHVELGDGTVLEVDALLEAMGVAPTTGWLLGSDLALEDGVVCDEVGQAADGVWAVGDVARWGGTRHEHWTSAVEQAAVVAAAILGDRKPATDPPYWWSDQYDVKLQGLGRIEPGDTSVVVEAGSRKRPLAVYSRDGVVTGVVGFSNAAAVFALKERIGDPVDEVLATLG